ncbi:Hypothetical protein SCLAV_0992 [Streptomyces clavuligerus]|uniref:Uncharacterized protein n=1 Tax=Streptomyces clavuligerus TaxID=1901 RepID=E2PXE8_STRCL|nr:Hypothetical protein SCLAV_0992 [Streptomyces clavuligerus]
MRVGTSGEAPGVAPGVRRCLIGAATEGPGTSHRRYGNGPGV